MCKLLTADWHLDDSVNAEYRWGIFPYLHKMINLHRVESIYLLGDLTDKKNNHDAKFVSRLISNFESLTEEFFLQEIIILKGNHDYTDEKSPFFSFLKNFKKMQYVSYPVNCDGEQWLPNTKNWEYELNHNASHIFIHQPIQNAKIGNTFLKNGLPISCFEDIDDNVIFAGDIHSPQKIGNVTYIGAPYHINFGDAYAGRILLMDENKIKEVSTAFSFPQKLKISTTSDKLMEINSFKEIDPDIDKGDFLKVTIELFQSDKHLYPEFKKKVRRLAENDGVQLFGTEMKLVKGLVEIRAIKKGINDQEIVYKYLKDGNVIEYVKYAKEIMDECSNS